MLLSTCKPNLGDAEQAAVQRVLASGYLGMGPELRAFESELEAYLGNERTVCCVNTGTSALHLAVAALELPAGAEVLVPTLTYLATFQAVVMAGAVPVACDVDGQTGLLDLDDAEKKLTKKTRVILPVHYAGNPGDLGAVYRFALANRLRVVEDAAHAFGSRWDGARIGTAGDIVCFSFDPIKNITSGEGGAIVATDPAFCSRVIRMRNLGIERTAEQLVGEDFDVTGAGWRYHMPDVMAAIGRVQLQRFETELKPRRQALAEWYRIALADMPGVALVGGGAETVPHIIVIRMEQERRDKVRRALLEAGYETKIHYRPNHTLAAFHAGGEFPVAEALYRQVLTLPSHHEVTKGDVEAIASIVERVIGRPQGHPG